MERKEAIEVIKKNWPDSSFTRLREALETLIPELQESEDERIRQDIITTLSMGVACEESALHPGAHTTLKEAIDWLEKQGENNMGISEATKQKLEDNLNNALEKETPESWNKFLDEQGEQKPDTDFSDIRTWKYIVDAVWTEKEGIGQYLDSPFTEEVAKKLQKRFGNIEQKPWSEEDDQYPLVCKNALAKYQVSDKWDAIIISRWLEDKLKSLRPQNTWKPSDEQMDALHDAAVYVDKSMFPYPKGILMKLYKQLKKLREE